MSTQLVDLFDVFSETFGKDKAHRVVKDIDNFLSDHKRELATKEDIHAVKADIRETELRLIKEIEQVRSDLTKEIEQMRSDLTKEIEQMRSDLTLEIEHVRGEIKGAELRLTREIESVKLQVEQVKSSVIKWVVGWVAGLLIAYTGAIFTIITLMK